MLRGRADLADVVPLVVLLNYYYDYYYNYYYYYYYHYYYCYDYCVLRVVVLLGSIGLTGLTLHRTHWQEPPVTTFSDGHVFWLKCF